jgi:hypothetical protein
MAQQYRTEPGSLRGDGLLLSPPKLHFDLSQLGAHPLRDRPPFHPKRPRFPLPTHVGEAEEVEALGFPQPPLLTSFSRKAPKLNQAGLVWVQFQPEVGNPLPQGLQELLGVLALFETRDHVVNVSSQAHISLTVPLTPLVRPQIEHIMEVDVGRERRETGPLRTAYLTENVLAVLQHTGLQPFLDESHNAPIRYAVLNELHQPSVSHGIEGFGNFIPLSTTHSMPPWKS